MIIVGENEYQGTPGLWELITMKLPNDQVYDDEDYGNYADILVKTNALKRGNVSESRTPKVLCFRFHLILLRTFCRV